MKKIKYHILVVDDDDRIRELVQEYLKDNEFVVSTSNSAEEAKIKLGYFKFDLIVLDVMMPGQNGFDLTKEIKKNSNVPIILLTAKGEVESRIEGLELGADDYLSKPVDSKTLLAALANSKVNHEAEPVTDTLSVEKVEWEYIQQVLKANDGNVSATARQLSMHRRTLQRKLQKRPSAVLCM